MTAEKYVTHVNTNLPKICHAKVGGQVRLPDPKTGEVLPEVFVVVAVEEPQVGRRRAPRAARSGMMHGLYDDERKLMLVSLTTGITRPMPHLSSRAQILRADELQPYLPEGVLCAEVKEDALYVEFEDNHNVAEPHLHKVDLNNKESVKRLLDWLCENSPRYSVSAVSTAEELLKKATLASWREAVAKGDTLLSFDEFFKNATGEKRD